LKISLGNDSVITLSDLIYHRQSIVYALCEVTSIAGTSYKTYNQFLKRDIQSICLAACNRRRSLNNKLTEAALAADSCTCWLMQYYLPDHYFLIHSRLHKRNELSCIWKLYIRTVCILIWFFFPIARYSNATMSRTRLNPICRIICH